MGQLTQLVRIKDPDQQMKLAEECAKEDWSVKALKAKVDGLLGGPEGEKQKNEKPKQKSGFHFSWKGDILSVKGSWVVKGRGSATLSDEMLNALSDYLLDHPGPKKG